MDYIFEAAEKKMRGTPATGVDEIAWLRAFLDARYKLLYSYGKNERASVKRIEIYQKLVDTGECCAAGCGCAGLQAGQGMVARWPVPARLLPGGLHLPLALALSTQHAPRAPYPHLPVWRPSPHLPLQATTIWTAPSISTSRSACQRLEARLYGRC